MPSKGKYSGVPTDANASSASAPSRDDVPVALPVAADGPAGSVPHATKVSTLEIGSSGRDGASNKSPDGVTSEQDDSGSGIQVEWTKGEHQPPGFRDKWFAVAFVVHVVAVLATSVTLGPAGLAKLTADGEDGVRRMLGSSYSYSSSSGSDSGSTNKYADLYDDDNSSRTNSFSSSSSSHSSSSSSGDMPPPPEGFWIAIAGISLLAAPILSVLALSFMSQNAVLLIQISLFVGVAICGLAAVGTIIVAPPAGILYAILTIILIWYAKSVWHRIPYAASNLRSGIAAVRSNLGVAFVAVGAVPALVLWSFVWTLALFGTLETDWMKNQIEVEGGGDAYGQDPDEEISGIGIFVIMLFMLSFYWTHQVLKNIVRTSVAGVVGTWWFTPLEASSFCSAAVRDSFGRATTYSLGSICLGSLIVAILHVLRNSLRSASNNRRAGILRCIAACLLLYLERLVEYFNKWAFIYVGLYGYGYIEAGKNVMSLFKARGWTAIISDNLVNRLLSIVSLTIGLMVGVATLLVALMFEEFESKGGWLGIGFIIGFLVGVMLSSIMMGVVSSAVDAIIVCFAEAPAEFKESHPELSDEMQGTWAAAWPDLQFGGPVIVSLGGGLGIV